jgi:hypothetical protein
MADSWLGRQYNEIKGHAKWEAIKLLGGIAITAAYFLLQKFRHLEYDWFVAGGIFVVSIILIFFVAGRTKKDAGQQLQNPSPGKTTSAITVKPDQPFNTTEFFRHAYYSPALQAETEARMRAAADENQPNDREGFYLKFISVGVLVYNYDMIWFVIYRSQLEALLDVNRHNGILPLAQVKSHYDQAAAAYSEEYKKGNVLLENWLGFLIARTLVIRHPSDMIEITVRGKDFLKYLVHWGRESTQRHY